MLNGLTLPNPFSLSCHCMPMTALSLSLIKDRDKAVMGKQGPRQENFGFKIHGLMNLSHNSLNRLYIYIYFFEKH